MSCTGGARHPGTVGLGRIAAETADNDFAAAFLVLAGRLGLTE